MLNTVPAVAAGRQPRGVVKVSTAFDGSQTILTGWDSWEVKNNSYYEADTFRVTVAVSGLPAALNLNWFLQQTQIFVEVFVGFPTNPGAPNPDELDSLIYGRVDMISFDALQREMMLTGRDLTGILIDAKATTQFTNQSASAIATTIAGQFGLAASITPTKGFVGTPDTENSLILLQPTRSYWDLLADLARNVGFVAYIQGTMLYFGPDITDASNPYQIQWMQPTKGAPQANVIDLKFSRNLTVTSGVVVTVASAGLYGGTALTRSYPSSGSSIKPGKAAPYSGAQHWYYTMPPGKTAAQVIARAEAIYNSIIQQEMKLDASMPGDNLLSMQSTIQLSGTGTAFDQTYYPREITREMSMGAGYSMSVQAQNSSPNLAPAEEPTSGS